MAYMSDGALNSAICSFPQALLTGPGSIEANQAVDDMEVRVKFSSKPDDVMVKLNINCVRKEF